MRKNISFWWLILGGVAILQSHMDMLFRLLGGGVEWFEFYQSFLLSWLSAFAFLLFARTLLCFKRRFLHFGDYPQQALFCLAAAYVACSMLAADLLIEIESIVVRNGIFLFAVLVLSAGLLQQKDDLVSISRKPVFRQGKHFLRHYLDLVWVFTFVCLCYDLYLLEGPQAPERHSQAEKKKNVIVITLDTVRADRLPMYGYGKPTMPFLRSISQQALVYEKVFSTTSWTLPSHASLFTGLDIHEHGATRVESYVPEHLTLVAECFKDSGYFTAAFVGGPFAKAKYGFRQGFHYYFDRMDFWEERNIRSVVGAQAMLGTLLPELSRKILGQDGEVRGAEIHQRLLPWLAGVEEPFFLFVNYFDAHHPYDQGQQYRQLFTEEQGDASFLNDLVDEHYFDFRKRAFPQSISQEQERFLNAMYDAELRVLDNLLAELWQALQQRGLLENTVILVTADHGEEFFDHGGTNHGITLYQEVLHVPGILFHPERGLWGRHKTPMSIKSFFGPLAKESGGSCGKEQRASWVAPEGHKASAIRAERFPIPLSDPKYTERLRAIYVWPWKLITVDPPRPRIPNALFHLGEDPEERNNLWDDDKEKKMKLLQKLSREGALK